MITLTDLNCFRKSVLEFCPFIDSAMMDFAKDFELPGFPTTNSGILSWIHTTIMNTFSLRAALRAMLGPSTMFERNASWQLKDIELNSNKTTLDKCMIELHHYSAWSPVELGYAIQWLHKWTPLLAHNCWVLLNKAKYVAMGSAACIYAWHTYACVHPHVNKMHILLVSVTGEGFRAERNTTYLASTQQNRHMTLDGRTNYKIFLHHPFPVYFFLICRVQMFSSAAVGVRRAHT